MTYAELVGVMAKESGMPEPLVERMMFAFTEQITEALKRGESVEIPEFGMFAVKVVPNHTWQGGKEATNLQNLTLPEKRVPYFRSAGALRRHLNHGEDWKSTPPKAV
ncbi:MAG: HU family DNA-binding protein [Magnetococcales bacterium]|nr:HU family DNA-binding protein [Magnetococcales bacterium]